MTRNEQGNTCSRSEENRKKLKKLLIAGAVAVTMAVTSFGGGQSDLKEVRAEELTEEQAELYASSNKTLAAPKTKVSVQPSGIKVSWSKSAGAKKYVIYRKQKGGKWKKLKTVNKSKTSYTIPIHTQACIG